MRIPNPSRRVLGLSALSTLVLTACGGGGGGSIGSGGGSSSSSSSGTLPDPATAPALKTYFAGKFKVGMAIEPARTTELISSPILLKHVNSITAENAMKANPIGVSAGVYNYTEADKLVTFAQTNGMEVRGHALVWHTTSPDWFFAGDQTDMTAYRTMVRQRLETYITDVCTHFKGKIACWDVVNEVASDVAGETYRKSRWYDLFGADYIEWAFRAARAADPAAKLFINEYSTEDPSKRARLMTIVQTLLDRGVPIDGVGHQLHINVSSPTITEVENALVAVEAKGLINHVTELDVSIYTDPGSCYGSGTGCVAQVNVGSAAYNTALRQQAEMYRRLYNLFAARPSVQSVTTWGVADDHTWLNTWPVTRKNYPLLFDTAGQPKPAFWAVVDPAFVP